MAARFLLALPLLAALAACGGLSNSPLGGLFGGARSAETDTSNPESDPRPLVDRITALTLERVPGGAILRATGLPPRQGYFDAALLALNGGRPVDGTLAFQLRAAAPPDATRPGPETSRELIVAVFLSDQALAAVRAIQVSAARNALAVRR